MYVDQGRSPDFLTEPPTNSNILEELNSTQELLLCLKIKLPNLLQTFFLNFQVHRGLLCCYCTKLFKKVSDLEIHIKTAHRVPTRYYPSTKQFSATSGQKYNFVCSQCSCVLSIKDLDKHSCKISGKKTYECPFCNREFASQAPLDVHISNGWCPEISKSLKTAENRKIYKVLTGKESDSLTFQQEIVKKKPALPPPPPKNVNKKPKIFSVHDRRIYEMFKNGKKVDKNDTDKLAKDIDKKEDILPDVPLTGSIYHSSKSRGLNSMLKKELNDLGEVWRNITYNSSDLEVLKLGDKFCVNDLTARAAAAQHVAEHLHQPPEMPFNNSNVINESPTPLSDSPQRIQHQTPKARKPNRRFGPKILPPVPPLLTPKEAMENKENTVQTEQKSLSSLKISIPLIKKESKAERIARATREIPANFEKLRNLLSHLGQNCTFCQQAHHIHVDSVFLLSHLLILHDRQLINSYLGEDAQDSISRIKSYIRDAKLKEVIFTFHDDKKFDEIHRNYKCSCCPVEVDNLSELFEHLDQNHNGQKRLVCHLCQNIFLNYGSYRSHVCFGPPSNGQQKIKFLCPVCQNSQKSDTTQELNSYMEFQRHLRGEHNGCDVCFHMTSSPEELSHHCFEEHREQELMCMICFMTYENITAFRKHLYYKHEEEHSECSKCHQKTWNHVYHFCMDTSASGPMICEVCETQLGNLARYKVHIRTHTGSAPHICSVRGCKKSYVSKHLLLKHHIRRHPDLRPIASAQLEQRRHKKFLEKMGASSLENVQICQGIVAQDLLSLVIPNEVENPVEPEKNPEKEPEKPVDNPENDQKPAEPEEAPNEEPEFDPIASAVASIMGPEGNFDIRKSPVKPVIPHHIPPKHIPMPPLMPIEKKDPLKSIKVPDQTTPVSASLNKNSLLKSSSSLLKTTPNDKFVTPVDPLKEMLKNSQNKNRVPEKPSSILPPSSLHQIMNGNVKNHDDKTDDEEKVSDHEKTEKKVSSEKVINPVLGGIWNQDLMFLSNATESKDDAKTVKEDKMEEPLPKKGKGCKVMKPRFVYFVNFFRPDEVLPRLVRLPE